MKHHVSFRRESKKGGESRGEEKSWFVLLAVAMATSMFIYMKRLLDALKDIVIIVNISFSLMHSLFSQASQPVSQPAAVIIVNMVATSSNAGWLAGCLFKTNLRRHESSAN